ncbi:MAG: mercury transporter MerT [Robiginitomaculum sp.]|nr:MAG: mercury transporter MerT [Robiginitomaculum sp.]
MINQARKTSVVNLGKAPPYAPASSPWLATGGMAGAIIASSCCIVPLVLVMLGLSGAWVSNLTALEPYKPIFLLITAGLIGAGFWQVYRRPKQDCDDGSLCAKPASRRITKLVLWVATALALLAASVNFWAPWFY